MDLVVDTATRFACVALVREGQVQASLTWRSTRNHTAELAPAVQSLLERAGLTPRDLTALFVVKGPGGFSALRAGMALAKGMAVALGLPLVGVGTLEAEAWPYLGLGLPVCPLLPMGRGEYAWAVYRGEGGVPEEVRPPALADPATLVAETPRPALFCGEGARDLAPLLRERLGREARIPPLAPPTRHPGAVAHLAQLRLDATGPDNPATLQPLYLRRPSITLRGTPSQHPPEV